MPGQSQAPGEVWDARKHMFVPSTAQQPAAAAAQDPASKTTTEDAVTMAQRTGRVMLDTNTGLYIAPDGSRHASKGEAEGHMARNAPIPGVNGPPNPQQSIDEFFAGGQQNPAQDPNVAARMGAFGSGTGRFSGSANTPALGYGNPQESSGARAALLGKGANPVADVVTGDNSTQATQDRVNQIIGGAEVQRSTQDEAVLRDAMATQRGLVDQIMAQPSQARAVAEQLMAEQRAQAVSARGGAAATQQAQSQAAGNVTGINAQATTQAAQEQAQKFGLAAQVTGQMGQLALGSEQNSVQVQQANLDAATKLAQITSELGFGETQLNQRDRENLGQIMRDLYTFSQQNSREWAQLSYEDRWKTLDNMLGYYQVDQQTKTQLQAIKMQKGKDFWDKLGIFGEVVKDIGGAAPKPGP